MNTTTITIPKRADTTFDDNQIIERPRLIENNGSQWHHASQSEFLLGMTVTEKKEKVVYTTQKQHSWMCRLESAPVKFD